MRRSKLARRQLRNHARYRGRNDLNIVPMLDVMVILAFFLIFTAVFSKTSVLEVNLPGPGAQAAPQAPTLELEVIVRRGGLEVADRNVGVLETVPVTASGPSASASFVLGLSRARKRSPPSVTPVLYCSGRHCLHPLPGLLLCFCAVQWLECQEAGLVSIELRLGTTHLL